MNMSFMPRYGTVEYRRLGIFMLLLAVSALFLLIPELAMAQSFQGDFGPNKDITQNVDKSFLAWWKTVAGWGIWIAVAALAISVLFFGGRFWWVPLAFGGICLFGETVVNGIRGLMG